MQHFWALHHIVYVCVSKVSVSHLHRSSLSNHAIVESECLSSQKKKWCTTQKFQHCHQILPNNAVGVVWTQN